MKKTTEITGIFYGKSKSGKSYRLLYLVDNDTTLTDFFEGCKTYCAFAPENQKYVVGQVVEIICHKGETIVLD